MENEQLQNSLVRLYGTLRKEFGETLPFPPFTVTAQNYEELVRVSRELRATPLPDGSLPTLRQLGDELHRRGYRSKNGLPLTPGEIQHFLGKPVKEKVSLWHVQPQTIQEVLEKLDISLRRVQLVMVNHRSVGPEHLVTPGDRVAVFPREYPFFPDWYPLRRKYAEQAHPD